ncbi:unnamed protein product [Linum tenue]|uniref:Uncharacterized protein n=1 Tax=Linum tenue TaxID=586396 RepID=A0AAV0IVM2_9ROSI|nr:unnamed protein product [Linum tenue]
MDGVKNDNSTLYVFFPIAAAAHDRRSWVDQRAFLPMTPFLLTKCPSLEDHAFQSHKGQIAASCQIHHYYQGVYCIHHLASPLLRFLVLYSRANCDYPSFQLDLQSLELTACSRVAHLLSLSFRNQGLQVGHLKQHKKLPIEALLETGTIPCLFSSPGLSMGLVPITPVHQIHSREGLMSRDSMAEEAEDWAEQKNQRMEPLDWVSSSSSSSLELVWDPLVVKEVDQV